MENEKTELTGGYQSSEENLESSVPISSRVDPTHVMPPFDEGKPVDGMTDLEARAEWNAMTVDSEGKYDHWPRKVFLDRRDLLFKKGFSEGIKQQQKQQAEKNRAWLDQEKERIAERDDRAALSQARRNLAQRLGGEKQADETIQRAQKAISVIAENSHDKGKGLDEYLEKTFLGNDPVLIEMAAKASGDKVWMKQLIAASRLMGTGAVIELLVTTYRNLGLGKGK